MDQKEAWGFGEEDIQQRGPDQRDQAGDVHQRTPAEGRNDEGCSEAGDQDPDRDAAGHDHNQHRSQPLGRIVRRQAECRWNRSPERQSNDEPDDQQRDKVGGKRGQQRSRRDRERGGDEDHPPSEPIRHRGDQDRPDQRGEHPAGVDQAEGLRVDVQLMRQKRAGVADGVGVHSLQHHQQRTEKRGQQHHAPKRDLVDKSRDFNRWASQTPGSLFALRGGRGAAGGPDP